MTRRKLERKLERGEISRVEFDAANAKPCIPPGESSPPPRDVLGIKRAYRLSRRSSSRYSPSDRKECFWRHNTSEQTAAAFLRDLTSDDDKSDSGDEQVDMRRTPERMQSDRAAVFAELDEARAVMADLAAADSAAESSSSATEAKRPKIDRR